MTTRRNQKGHQNCLTETPATPKPEKPKLYPKPPKPSESKNKSSVKTPKKAGPLDVKHLVRKINNQKMETSDEEDSISDQPELDSRTMEVNDEKLLKSSAQVYLEADLTTANQTKIIPEVTLPDSIRDSVGPNWRLKEAVLCSYQFGSFTIRPIDFARSKLDVTTADIIADNNFTVDAKKHKVKIFLGRPHSLIELYNH